MGSYLQVPGTPGQFEPKIAPEFLIMAQALQIMPITRHHGELVMPKDAYGPNVAKGVRPGSRTKYEDYVDEFIEQKQMAEGDTFMINDPEDEPDPGKHFYEFLGWNTGGRKDWREIKPNTPNKAIW